MSPEGGAGQQRYECSLSSFLGPLHSLLPWGSDLRLTKVRAGTAFDLRPQEAKGQEEGRPLPSSCGLALSQDQGQRAGLQGQILGRYRTGIPRGSLNLRVC